MLILVVDDSEDSRDIVETMLLAGGLEGITTVSSAAKAYEFLEIGAPPDGNPPPVDVILLDIMMPGIDGIEACARIRTSQRHADIPIIMVTGLSDMGSLANAFVAGATDYISKPVISVELIARVHSALKLKAQFDRRQARERELLEFMSTWGDRRASNWIDEATGLLTGEIAEAYLCRTAEQQDGEVVSVLALMIDRLDAYRAAQGEAPTRRILAKVAHALQRTAASVGVLAGAYRNGVTVLVAPALASSHARALANELRVAVSKLALANSESIAADHVTASVAVVTGCVRRSANRIHLLTHAIATLRGAEAAGGDRVVAVNV